MKASLFNNRRLRARLVALSAIVAAGMALASAPSAQATTCSLSNGVLDLNLTYHTQIATASGTIVISTDKAVTCSGGTPTTTNTDVVRVVDFNDNPFTSTPRDGSTTLEIEDPASFAPGRTLEDSATLSDIEFVVNMSEGPEDKLLAFVDDGTHANWTGGTSGFNWNGDADPDLMGGQFDAVLLFGDSAPDRISVQGGLGTGAPLVARTIELWGDQGGDLLLGSDGADDLSPEEGDDVVNGFGGDDDIVNHSGNDSFTGGPGADSVFLGAAAGPAAVDLARSDRQDTGHGLDSFAEIENLFGTNFSDTLLGDGSANVLTGGRGDDTLGGRGGSDELYGGDDSDTVTFAHAPGGVTADLTGRSAVQGADADKLIDVENLTGSPFADTLTGNAAANRIVGGTGADTIAAGAEADRVDARDGEADRASCGDGADSVIGDRVGVDSLDADCESLDLLPEPEQPQDGATDPGAGDPGTTPDTDLSFALGGSRSQRVLAQRSVRVRVACPLEPCTTTVRARARLRRSGRAARLRLAPVRTAVAAGSTRRVVLRLTRAQSRAVRRALAVGRRPTLRVIAQARDAAGNRVERTLRVAVKR